MNTISSQNPFFETYSTLHGTVPFDKIKTGDYVPAIREGIRRQNAEIEAIIRNPEVPTFANTVLAYEKSGEMLHRVSTVFGNLLSAETDDDLQELAKEIMPMMSEHENNISLNEELFARIKARQRDAEPGTAQAAGRYLQWFCTQRRQPPGRSQGEIPGFMQRAQPADAAVQRKQPERNERLQACHHRQVTTGRATRERGRSRCRDSRGKRRRRLGIHPAGSQLWPFSDLRRQP